MFVKSLILSLLLSLSSFQVLAQSAGNNQSPRSFVQAFYNWYVPLAEKGQGFGSSDFVLERKPAIFSPALIKALRDDEAAQARTPGEIVSLNMDPFLYSQEFESHYVTGDITQKANVFQVYMHGVHAGIRNEKPDVIVEVSRKNGRWVFINFHLPNGPDLLATLKEARQQDLR